MQRFENDGCGLCTVHPLDEEAAEDKYHLFARSTFELLL